MTRDRLHFFIVDDDESARGQLISQLTQHAIVPVHNAQTAHQLLNGAPDIDVALIDLAFPVGKGTDDRVRYEILGQGIVERLHERVPHAIVIAYSGDSDLVDEMATELRRLGADLVCRRREIFRSQARLLELVAEARANREDRLTSQRPLHPTGKEIVKSADHALVEEVSEHVIRQAATRVRPDAYEDHFAVLGGGKSGDWAVHMHSVEAGRPESDWVLKLSRNDERLRDEVDGASLFGEPGRKYAANEAQGVVTLDNGWFAIYSPFVASAKPLRDYLSDAPAASITAVLRAVADHLEPAWQAADQADSLVRGRPQRHVSWRFVAEIEAAVSELTPWLDYVSVSAPVSKLLGWLRDGADGKWRVVDGGTLVSRSHGDFHGQNILVRADGVSIAVIDFARGRMAPRFEDYVTLAVDLLVNGDLRSRWLTFTAGDAAELSAVLCRVDWRKPATGFPKEETGDLLATWSRYIAEKAATATEAELLQAFVLQCLRFCRFESFPATIRAMLVMLSARLLEQYVAA